MAGLDLRKNSVFFEAGGKGFLYSVNYERIFWLGPSRGLTAGAGFTTWDALHPVGEVNLLFGGPKHFLETGLGFEFGIPVIAPRIGYRYMAAKGFLFRIAPMYMIAPKPDTPGDIPFLGLSLGYSF